MSVAMFEAPKLCGNPHCHVCHSPGYFMKKLALCGDFCQFKLKHKVFLQKDEQFEKIINAEYNEFFTFQTVYCHIYGMFSGM